MVVGLFLEYSQSVIKQLMELWHLQEVKLSLFSKS